MLNLTTVRAVAVRLQEAEATQTQVRQLHLEYPSMDFDDAYAIQRELRSLKLAAGQRLIGHKIGLTSRAMQVSVGIDEPDFGVLMDGALIENGARVPFDRFIEPRVEIEIAFVLDKPLTGPHCGQLDVLGATGYVVPSIEIIDARVQRLDPETGSVRTIVDSISDNAVAAGVILGGRPFRPMDVDLCRVAGVLYRNGRIEETGVAAGVMSHPANAVAWLANKLWSHDEKLLAGHVILAGSFVRAVSAARGDTFHADFGHAGAVSFQFT